MKTWISIIFLVIALLLYFVGYHAYWNYANSDPFLLDMVLRFYDFFGGESSLSSEPVNVRAVSKSSIYEDILIGWVFIISMLLSCVVILFNYSKQSKVKVVGKHRAFLITSAFAVFIMDILFFLTNRLSIIA